ncbi:MAG: hypothetical protein ACRCU3_04350 [Eubacteriaceae bacterium]
MKSNQSGRDDLKNLISTTQKSIDSTLKETNRECEKMVRNLENWSRNLKERHNGLLSRAGFLDFICYGYMIITSGFFLSQFFSWGMEILRNVNA